MQNVEEFDQKYKISEDLPEFNSDFNHFAQKINELEIFGNSQRKDEKEFLSTLLKNVKGLYLEITNSYMFNHYCQQKEFKIINSNKEVLELFSNIEREKNFISNKKMIRSFQRNQDDYLSKKAAETLSEYKGKIKKKDKNIKKLKSTIAELEERLERVRKSDISYDFKFSDKSHKIELSNFIGHILPSTKGISLDFFEEDPENIKKLMLNSIKEKVDCISFNRKKNEIDDIPTPVNEYMEGLKHCLPKAVLDVSLREFEINSQQLEIIIKACKNTKSLRLIRCILATDNELDFDSKIDYKIEILDFSISGYSKRSNWKGNIDRLANIINSISNCSLKRSLNEIVVTNCGIPVEKVEEMLEEHGLKSIKVLNLAPSSK